MNIRKTIVLTGLILTMSLVFSFESQAQILPTKLRMTIIDDSGSKVEAAEVIIYTKEEDYRASENVVFRGKTNKKGKLTFKEAKTILYFIEVKKGEMTNIGEGVQTGPLAKGKINKVVINIR